MSNDIIKIIHEKIEELEKDLRSFTVGLLQMSDMQDIAKEKIAQVEILKEILELNED